MLSFINSYRKEKVLEAVKLDSYNITQASKKLRDDRDIAIEVIKGNPNNIKFLGDKVRDQLDIALFAVDKNPLVCNYISDRLKTLPLIKEMMDTGKSLRLIARERVLLDTSIIKLFPKFLLQDMVFMKELLELNGESLKYMLPRVRADKNMVKVAIKDSPLAIRHASKKLREDLDLIFRAVNKDTGALGFLDIEGNKILDKVKSDKKPLKEVIYELAFNGEEIYQDIPRNYLVYLQGLEQFKDLEVIKKSSLITDDERLELALKIIEENPRHYLELDECLKNNKEFVLKALRRNVGLLPLLPKSITKSREFMSEASKITSKALLFIGEDLGEDNNFVLETIRAR